ncbi:class II glutamine amidotransferase [Photobacterium piscicola]|uniref:class II glutamine amidotransferase n=1 Tax=Photobacterium piscicola TaxID=1378299 RepID=UPI00373615E1
MSRWLAYHGDSIYLDELIYQPEHSLIQQSVESNKKRTVRANGDGFGLGWYSHRALPGYYHDILPAWGDENLRSLAHHISSHRFMAHIRHSTGSQVSRVNCHPFVLDNWMFLHNGQISGFDQVKFTLVRQLTEELFLKRVGTTDSELIFLMMIKNGLRIDPIAAINQTLYEIEQAMEDKSITGPLKTSLCISDGEQFWVVRYSSDRQPPPVFIQCSNKKTIIASEPLDHSDSWQKIPRQTITHIVNHHCTQHDLIID